jgi:hypothetical protein
MPQKRPDLKALEVLQPDAAEQHCELMRCLVLVAPCQDRSEHLGEQDQPTD